MTREIGVSQSISRNAIANVSLARPQLPRPLQRLPGSHYTGTKHDEQEDDRWSRADDGPDRPEKSPPACREQIRVVMKEVGNGSAHDKNLLGLMGIVDPTYGHRSGRRIVLALRGIRGSTRRTISKTNSRAGRGIEVSR